MQRGTSRKLLAACGSAQLCKIGADARSVDPEIAAPETGGRADVDAAARTRCGDADHDVVGKAEPAAPVARLDAARRVVGSNDRPSHPLRRVKRPIERDVS